MRTWLPILALALAACGDAVTNPSLEGFEHDPSPVQGRWVTTLRLASGEVQTFEADLTPAGGVFLGSFEFFRPGQLWQIQFADAGWDGGRVLAAVRRAFQRRLLIPWALIIPPGPRPGAAGPRRRGRRGSALATSYPNVLRWALDAGIPTSRVRRVRIPSESFARH
jgi:hypothetical protein